MSNTDSLPVIAGVEITTDSEGRFSLNALHRASGLGDSKKPSNWLETQTAKELILELKSQSGNSAFGTKSDSYDVLKVRHGGNAPGTFADQLLAVSYAGWISPKFQLEVNRVFIEYKTGRSDKPKSFTPVAKEFMAHYRVAKLFYTGNQALLAANKATRQSTGVDAAQTLGATHLLAAKQEPLLTPTDLGTRLDGQSAKAINNLLAEKGFQLETRDLNGRLCWELTETGKRYAVYMDTGKKRSDGTPVRQIKWLASVLNMLRSKAA